MTAPAATNFDDPPTDPLGLFAQWFAEAKAAAARLGLPNPHAMSLATVDAAPLQGRPSSRMVLLKSIDAQGAVFYTNRDSRKGLALAANPRAALLFHWDALDRQVRIEGAVTETSASESDAYFASRARLSQIGAWASAQSRPLKDREALEIAVAGVLDRFTGPQGEELPIPRPPHWGGYRVALEMIEFWQGQTFRLHDRIAYTQRPAGGWHTTRLYP